MTIAQLHIRGYSAEHSIHMIQKSLAPSLKALSFTIAVPSNDVDMLLKNYVAIKVDIVTAMVIISRQ